MRSFIFLWIQLILETLWIIKIININVRSKKNIIAVNMVLIMLNAIVLLNIGNIFKTMVLLHIINLT